MFLVSLEKWEDLVKLPAWLKWARPAIAPDTKTTLLTDIFPLVPADSSVCNSWIRGTVGGEGKKGYGARYVMQSTPALGAEKPGSKSWLHHCLACGQLPESQCTCCF